MTLKDEADELRRGCAEHLKLSGDFDGYALRDWKHTSRTVRESWLWIAKRMREARKEGNQ